MFKNSILSFVFIAAFMVGTAQNITVTPNSNPASIVVMGDSLVFSPGIMSDAAISNAELEVEVPAGFELLVSTPNFKSGSLINGKKTGRILIASLSQNSLLTLTVYVKALCDAETAAQAADRRMKYRFYPTASSTPVEAISPTIQNFNPPILNIRYPSSDVVPPNVDHERTFTVIQTRNYSHVNNVEVTVAGDPSGIHISKVEARRNSGNPWTEVKVETSPVGYRYVILRDSVFTPAKGYLNRQLGYGDTLLIRETVSLRKCDQGSLDYSFSYGDGATFCSPAASTGNVTYSQPEYAYTPDINQTAFYNPGGPASDGRFVTRVLNNSAQAEATMHDLYVSCSGLSNYTVNLAKAAYFTDAAGVPVLNNGDTVFIPMSSAYEVRFYELNNPALAAYYEARGLRDLDGDGRYGDLPQGNSFYFAVKYNYRFNTGPCHNSLVAPFTRIFTLYYKPFCTSSSYRNYVRNYSSTDGSSVTTTNAWQGGFSFSSIRNIAIIPANLQNNDQARVSGNLYYDGNGSVTGVRGPNLFNLATSAIGVSSYYSTIVLPAGLSFDATQANPVRIGSSNVPMSSYTVSTGLDTVRIKWTANWGYNNYSFNIAVRNNGTPDNAKTTNIYHEYDYGNTGVPQKFGCVNALVPYLQLLPCSYLGITSLNIERRSFGYTDISKNTRVTDPEVARSLGFNMKIISPYDDVDVEGQFTANTNISTTGGNKIRINFNYVYGSALFDVVSGSPNGISVYYHNSATPIQIPSSAMTRTSISETQSIECDVAPYLSAAGINTLNTNDFLKVIMHLRATASLPTLGVDLYAQMQPFTVIGSNTHECSPISDVVRIWNSDWGAKVNCYTGGCISNFYHNITHDVTALNFTVAWATGQTNVWGNEYRPNGDNFSSVTIRYPNLLRINKIEIAVRDGIKGNMVNQRVLNSGEYTVTYSAGETYITINSGVTRDHMSSSSQSGIGYRINFDMINPTADNNTGYMPYFWYTLSFDNYPTSAMPRRDDHPNARSSIEANGGMINYPYKYIITPIPVNAAPTGTRAEWTVRITNQSNFPNSDFDLPHSWLAVECPPGVVPHELRNASTGTPVPATFEQYASGAVDKYWIKIGTVTANPIADYILSCTYACTGTPQLTLKYGMSKVDYPSNPDDGYSNYNSQGKLAGVVSTNISYTPPAINFAGRLIHYTNAANSTNMFCDSVMFEGEYSNGLATNVGRLQLRVILPSAGVSYYPAYTPEVKFSNGVWADVQSVDVSNPGELLITLDDSKELLAYGSPDSGDHAWVRYALHISCGIENGMQFPVEFIGYSGCETPAIKSAVDVAPLKISGLSPPPEYWVQDLSLISANDYIYTSGSTPTNGETRLSGKYLLAGDAEANVIAIIDLPPNLRMEGSNTGDLSFTQTGTSLIADLPSGDITGTYYAFDNILLVPENPAEWLEDNVTVYIGTGKNTNMACGGQTCVVTDKIIADSVKFALKKLDIRFSDSITARGSYGGDNAEQVVIDGWLANDGVSQYFDADALNLDLWYSDGASWLPVAGASGLRVSNITYDGDSVAFQITASVPSSMDVCNMAVVLRKNNSENSSKNPWLADSVSIAVPTPAYEITSQPLPVCQMAVNASIGEKPISGYQYEWNPATYLSGGGIGTPLDFTYDYMTSPLPDGGVLQYLVTVTRPAGCKSTDTVFVELKGIPAVKAVDDIEVCHGSGLSVNFEDNTNSGGSPTEFSWVIEAVTGDISKTNLPGSGTGNINKSPIVNPTGASIFAKYIVTPHKDGCDGVADTFNIKVLPSSILNYPDIRLNTCPGTTVNLSKYIDTVEYPSVVWKSVYGAVSPSGEVVIDGSRTSGVLTFTYEVTNRCVTTALTRKAYLKILSGNIRRQHNTLTVCYDQAEALQINQIIGIEAGGTFTYTADNGADLTPYIRESSTYGGAITMNGRAIYETAGARTVTVTYTPAPDSCLDGKIFTVTIVLF